MDRPVIPRSHLDWMWQEREELYKKMTEEKDTRIRRNFKLQLMDISHQIINLQQFEQALGLQRDHSTASVVQNPTL